jgi:cobalt-zinc-cadmium efflux system outer membrane protein
MCKDFDFTPNSICCQASLSFRAQSVQCGDAMIARKSKTHNSINFIFLIACLMPISVWAQGGQRDGQRTSRDQAVTLDQAIREALEKNLGLLAERFNISVAEARVIQARLRPNPVLNLGLDYQNAFGETFTLQNGAGPPEWNARIDYLIERGSKRQSRIDVAQNAKEVARLQLLNTTRNLVLDVQNAFLDVQSSKELLQNAKANQEALSEIVRINTLRVNAGDLAKVDEMRSRVAALQSKNAVISAELKLRAAKNHLQTLLGRATISDSFDVSGDIRRDDSVLTLEGLRKQALELRPDLLALRRDQARSLSDIRSQLAQGKVDFTLGTQYHHQYDYIHADSLGFFFSAPLPLFNRNQGEILRATQESRQIETKIRALEFSIASEISGAYDQYSSSKSLLENIEKSMLVEAKEVRRITEYSYKRGEATLLEFLDAQRAFNDTMQNYNDARSDYARSLYLLDSVAGRAGNP